MIEDALSVASDSGVTSGIRRGLGGDGLCVNLPNIIEQACRLLQIKNQ